jgi:hypothetical protein
MPATVNSEHALIWVLFWVVVAGNCSFAFSQVDAVGPAAGEWTCPAAQTHCERQHRNSASQDDPSGHLNVSNTISIPLTTTELLLLCVLLRYSP